MRSGLVTALGLLGVAPTVVLGQNPHHQVDANLFPGITPNAKLQWHDCYEKFKCARLLVPAKVDCSKKPAAVTGGDKVALAIVKLPYVPGPNDPPRKGAVHVALGGWSASSTNFLVRFGEDYAPLFVGYDLVAIDYRGWGWSTPSMRCFANEKERQQFAASEPALLGYNNKALEDRRKRAEDFAGRCKKNGGSVAKYMGSLANAVDHYAYMRLSGDKNMSFWGISSGTHVGQTVASLYPEAVDKFLLDSVAPSNLAYTVTTAQAQQIKNSDKALEAFFYTCLQSTDCAFKGNSTTTAELRARFKAVDAGLKTKALKVPGSAKPFDWSALHTLLSLSEHTPPFFPVLGGALAEAEAKAPGGFISYFLTNVSSVPPAPLPLLDESVPFEGLLSGVAIDEANHIRNDNEFRGYFDKLMAAAPTVASIFGEWRLVGQKWKIDTINRYKGGFAKVNLASTGGKVVVMANAADPAASLDSANAVASRFSPSVVVKNLAAGHTAFVALSDCLFGVMYQLFVLDIMPTAGSTCGNIYTPPFGVQLPESF